MTPVTREQVREALVAAGFADEAETVLDEAQKYPGRYAYTANRWRCVVYHMPAATWYFADCRESEQRIAALSAARRHGWRLVP